MIVQYPQTYPPVTDALLREIVARICAVGDPIKIILFGSRARGDARSDSDIDLLVIDSAQRALIEQRPGQAPQRLAEVAGKGRILDGTTVAGVVVALHEQGLQRIRLADGSARFWTFDQTAGTGALTHPDNSTILYETKIDNAQAEFGVGTAIGRYQAGNDASDAILTLARNVRVLHLSADQQNLFLLPVGQDPAFSTLLVVDSSNGQIRQERAIEGELFAAISPDGRFLATTARRTASTGAPEGWALLLYDLSASTAEPRVITLPQAPGHAWGLTWSPDSRALYFLLRPGDLYDDPASSLGVWRLMSPRTPWSR
ncbi:nucleotidyltransferase domain-containing protein [Roseiflexus sp.]|uniref:nucleotidyltransferase domain-containing protein n=1 Tax=Roseiflexus sp. TaxID=2562120 RepID=UPI00258C4E38|nr:nucleotidyltransferase domain-containing protein [Roseiflexus sp.]